MYTSRNKESKPCLQNGGLYTGKQMGKQSQREVVTYLPKDIRESLTLLEIETEFSGLVYTRKLHHFSYTSIVWMYCSYIGALFWYSYSSTGSGITTLV